MIKDLFDIHIRMEKIDSNDDPLVMLNQMIDWEIFRAELQTLRPPKIGPHTGRKPETLVRKTNRSKRATVRR